MNDNKGPERPMVDMPRHVGVDGYQGQEYSSKVVLSDILLPRQLEDRTYALLDGGDTATRVYVRTENNMYLITATGPNPKDPDVNRREYRLIDVTTNRNAGKTSKDLIGRVLEPGQLEDVLVEKGQPITFGPSSETGRGMVTNGKVVEIIAVDKTRPVTPGTENQWPVSSVGRDFADYLDGIKHLPTTG